MYRCRREELPTVEGALVAHEFVIVAPVARAVGGYSSVMLRQLAAHVLLQSDAMQEVGTLSVWGKRARVMLPILRTLPIVFDPDVHRDGVLL